MWTEEKVRLFEELVALELSASQIGEKMGITRNAVIGKAHRMGIRINPNSPQSQLTRLGLRKPPKVIRMRPSVPRAAKVFIPGAVLMREPTPAGAVAFIDAKPGQCRWFQPNQEGARGLICARDTVPGHSYCKTHYLRSLRSDERSGAAVRISVLECTGEAA
jgi:GcrA cell cycle regulator